MMATPWINSGRRSGAPPISGGISIAFTNIDEILDEFDSTQQNLEEATRPAAQAGAQVFYDEVKRNVSTLGDVFATTGRLSDAIYQVFSKDNSVGNTNGTAYNVASYHVSWNHKKAPHGHLVEFGHMQPYVVYRSRDGRLHTKVRPEKLKEYLAKYHGRTVPKELRSQYFIPYPVPKQVPAYPFVRPAMAKADEAYERASEILWAAVNK